MTSSPAPKASRGIQSIEVGSQLLHALVHLGRPTSLTELAREAGMTSAKAHPYLVSFGKVGLIQQDEATGRYGLGPLALQVGLISLQQSDPVRLASIELPRLALAIGHTVGIAIWGNRGPTFVRLEEGPTPIYVNRRHGTVVSLDATASGRLFAAFAPRDKVLAALRLEGKRSATLDARFEAELGRIRSSGLSVLTNGTVEGVTALSAPVFDGFGQMVLALTAIGPSATLDHSPDGAPAKTLVACAADLSARLGARATTE